jgi:uncharacterized protein
MDGMWLAVAAGDVDEMERLVGQDPGLLDARIEDGTTPLMAVSLKGDVGVVRWLLDHGAAINERDDFQCTALCMVSSEGLSPVVRLLLERGADRTLADHNGVDSLDRRDCPGAPRGRALAARPPDSRFSHQPSR